MQNGRATRRPHWLRVVIVTTIPLATMTITAACHAEHGVPRTASAPTVLRVGVAQVMSSQANEGLRQVSQLLSVESLVRPSEDGRMQPALAESTTPSSDGRTLTVKLRPNVKFHDGSSLDGPTVAALLGDSLRAVMGPIFADVERVAPLGSDRVVISFREPSLFLREALDAPLQKPGTRAGTGPFKGVAGSTTDMQSNGDYYLGQPSIDSIHVETFPNVRAAWAELLRDRIDMLWEVGPDALESMRDSSTVSLFSRTRPYQHAIVFNTDAPALPANVRRALSYAVDRSAIVQAGLKTYGVPSSGPIWPKHWANAPNLPQFTFDPQRAVDLLGGPKSKTHFTCLVAPDSLDERIGLEVKRQLAAVGIDMDVQGASRDEIFDRGSKGQYEAVILEVLSGPTLFRPYLVWHSNALFNFGKAGSPTIDHALDRVRHAPDEASLRTAVAGMQQAFMDDPPAVFLAWSVRARAVSKRFAVPAAEPGRDILSTLRLWKPNAAERQTSPN